MKAHWQKDDHENLRHGRPAETTQAKELHRLADAPKAQVD